MSAATLPAVLAQPGQPRCGRKGADRGVYCERPEGHAGGHLSPSHDAYWQAAQKAKEAAA